MSDVLEFGAIADETAKMVTPFLRVVMVDAGVHANVKMTDDAIHHVTIGTGKATPAPGDAGYLTATNDDRLGFALPTTGDSKEWVITVSWVDMLWIAPLQVGRSYEVYSCWFTCR